MNNQLDYAPAIWCVVPAAGIGSRYGGVVPKQYSLLLGQTVAQHTLNRLLNVSGIEQVMVALNPNDKWFEGNVSNHPRMALCIGGSTRAQSVLNGLNALTGADDLDWVLVHDIARPCVRVEDIHLLIATLQGHAVGGILATPCSDTLKQVEQQNSISTLDRSQIWAAQTPQMFRLGLLKRALMASEHCTDEASAIEQLGFRPLIVEGHRDNIKVTQVEDSLVAEAILRYQQADIES